MATRRLRQRVARDTVCWSSARLRPGSGGLAARLINNHPLPDGNKRVGYLCALELVARDGGTWVHPPDDPDGDVTVAMIEGVAAGQIDEDSVTAWIAERLG